MNLSHETRLNDWLIGSTVICTSCGCVWLVPNLKPDDRYLCRQCGAEAAPRNGQTTADTRTRQKGTT
jgi:hypothetical protein